MGEKLSKVLTNIAERFKGQISGRSRFYVEVDIGEQGEELGYSDVKEKYRDVNAVVPLKEPVEGMKVRIDGRTFVNYAQFESGIVVPEYVAMETALSYHTYEPNNSMIRNFA